MAAMQQVVPASCGQFGSPDTAFAADRDKPSSLQGHGRRLISVALHHPVGTAVANPAENLKLTGIDPGGHIHHRTS
jgi:hypothetical protein